MAIEIVDLPIKNGDFPSLCKRLSEAKSLYFGHGTVNDTAQVVGGIHEHDSMLDIDTWSHKPTHNSKAHKVLPVWMRDEHRVVSRRVPQGDPSMRRPNP